MWDGLHDALYNQPFTPFESATEINSSRLYVAEQVYARYRATYEAIFGKFPAPLDDAQRFPQLTAAQTGCRSLKTSIDGNDTTGVDCHGMPGDQAEYDNLAEGDKDIVTRVVVNVGKALGAYERLLSCGPGRFDDYVHGNSAALSDAEKRGAELFVGKAHCTQCHSGPYFTDQQFHNVGLAPGGVGAAGRTYDKGDHGAATGLKAVVSDPSTSKVPTATATTVVSRTGPTRDGRCVSRAIAALRVDTSLVHAHRTDACPCRRGRVLCSRWRRSAFEGQSENFDRHLSSDEQADIVEFLEALDGPGPRAELLGPP